MATQPAPSSSSSSSLPGALLELEHYVCTYDPYDEHYYYYAQPELVKHQSAPAATGSFRNDELNVAVAVGDRSTLRRRGHIRRPRGASISSKESRRVSAPSRMGYPPSPSGVAGPSSRSPSSLREQDTYLSQSNNSGAAPFPPRTPKPYLYPIVTSELAAVPKMKHNTQMPPNVGVGRRAEQVQRTSSLLRHTSSSVLRGPRPLPTPQRKVSPPPPSNPQPQSISTPAAVVPTSASSPSSTTTHRNKLKKRSVTGSPATIWSQTSGPSSRQSSVFITITSPTEIGHHHGHERSASAGVSVQRTDVNDVDWSRTHEIMEQTLIVNDNHNDRNLDDDESDSNRTMTEQVDECSSASTTTAAPSPPLSPSARLPATKVHVSPPTVPNYLPLPSSRDDDDVERSYESDAGPTTRPNNNNNNMMPRRSRAYSIEGHTSPSASPRTPRYQGPWGRATQPALSPPSLLSSSSLSGDSKTGTTINRDANANASGAVITVGELLMQRWARAHAAATRERGTSLGNGIGLAGTGTAAGLGARRADTLLVPPPSAFAHANLVAAQ